MPGLELVDQLNAMHRRIQSTRHHKKVQPEVVTIQNKSLRFEVVQVHELLGINGGLQCIPQA
jgi:hypothetical protein